MTIEGSQDFSTIYDGTNYPQILQYTATGLTTGAQYQFRVYAVNFNGISPASSIYTFYSCVDPTGMSIPYLVSSTTSSITLGWTAPTDDGGCPIYTYTVYRDNGSGGSINNEVNSH